jgi:hypothetical protein
MEVASGSYDRENFVGQAVDYNMLRAYCIYAKVRVLRRSTHIRLLLQRVGGRVVGGK